MKKIRLKPLTPYFFGYKTTFGKRGDKDNGSYFVKSALYPQQTTVLGMLRKEILKQAGLLKRHIKDEWVDKNDRDEAVKLTGVGKFYFDVLDLDEKEKIRKKSILKPDLDLGVIKKIYPLLLYKKGNYFFEAPDIKEIKDDLFIHFDYKAGVWNKVFGTNGARVKKKKVFIPVEIVGNSKKDEDNAYFKKIAYKLAKDFEFVVFADIDFDLKSSVVKLGADNSLFEMVVEDTGERFEDINITLPYLNPKFKYTLLLSDSYIPELRCDFAVTDEVEFKTIKQKRKFYKTKPLYLYKKGSLIINNKTDIENKKYKKVGFNYTKEVTNG